MEIRRPGAGLADDTTHSVQKRPGKKTQKAAIERKEKATAQQRLPKAGVDKKRNPTIYVTAYHFSRRED